MRREELIKFVDSLYCPANSRDEVALLRKIVSENDYRPIEESDAGKMFNDCLIIETKGTGSRETYNDFYICRVDVGEVGPKMADVAIYFTDSGIATPRRISKNNIRVNIPA